MASNAIVTEPLEKESTDLVKRANETGSIVTADHYEQAVIIGKALRSMKKGIEDFFSPIKTAAHKAWKEVCSTENRLKEPVEAAQKALDRKIGIYLDEQERKRQEAERIAREAALKAEQDRLLAEASHLSETGQQEQAEQVLDQAVKVEAPPVVMPSAVPKIAGASQRTGWKFEITDLQALLNAVTGADEMLAALTEIAKLGGSAGLLAQKGIMKASQGKVPIGAIKADEVFLGQMARAMKANMKWPGIRVYSEQSVAMRG